MPAGGVVFDKSGNLYGATEDGGANGCNSPGPCGTVFKLSPPAEPGGAWTETVLYVFKGQAYRDGATPEGSVIIDGAGNLYGTTGYGGTGPCTLLGGPVGCGTVYEVSPPARSGDSWTEKVLYSFQGGNDGYVATGNLVFDEAGNLFGATLFGGGQGTTCDSLYGGNCGTVFELSPPRTKGSPWTEKVLHSFAGVGTGQQYGDGASPNGGLVLDKNGDVYGTTYIGGYNCPHNSNQGCGTVFGLKTPVVAGGPWIERVLYSFKAGIDGSFPIAALTLHGGSFYGTSDFTIFRLTPPKTDSGSWKKMILSPLNDNAYDPAGALTFGADGNIYGTAEYSNAFHGTVFTLELAALENGSPIFNLLYGFEGAPDGGQPTGNLVVGRNRSLYGTTTQGGTGTNCSFHGCGTVFEVSP